MANIEAPPDLTEEESEDWGEILPHSFPGVPTHQVVLFIDGAREIVPSNQPYLLCMYNHREARFRYKNSPDDEEDLDGVTLKAARGAGKGKEISRPEDDIHESAGPISIPSPSRLSISGYSAGSKSQDNFREAIHRMRRKTVRDPTWKAVMVIDVYETQRLLGVYIFDAGRKDAFRGHVQISLDYKVKTSQSLSLQPLKVSDHVTGKIMVTIYPVQNGNGDVRTGFEQLNVYSFNNLGNIGQGSLGTVHRILDDSSGTVYAMKVVNDIDLKSGEPGIKVRPVVHSTFVAGRKFALQSPAGLRIFQDYIPGGELFKVLKKPGGFSEKEIQFYIAELLLGLEDLHRCGIEDYCLRPKKILLDSLGHIVLSDFGLSVASDQVERILDAYSAPESFSKNKTDHLQNFWTLGIILLEMIFGYNPFQSMDVKETRKNILKGVVNLPQTKRSLAKGEGSQDLCRKLLRRNPQKRLGSINGAQDIKEHPFFADVDWAELRAKRVEPPLKPTVKIDPASVWKASLDTLTERFEASINLEDTASVPDAKQESGSFNLSNTHISANSGSFNLSTTHISANSEGAASYQSALSHESPSTPSIYATPSSRIQSLARGSGPTENSLLTKILSRSDKGLNPDSKFGRLLQERGLLLPPTEQLEWSGRGQHVEFRVNEPIPLKPLAAVGHGGSAMVDSVLCRRIKLARKVMVCNRRQKLETMINEVEHLQRLRHPHIVQLVGSYIQGSKFAILLYPVADWNLATFYELCSVEEEVRTSTTTASRAEYLKALSGFFPCLAHGLAYIHANTMKHLDVKPQNVLVRRIANDEKPFRIYLADFGISKKFADDNMSQTDGLIAKSRKYCSPEVYDGEPRGRAADVFSLGCVFSEMATILCNISLDQFADFRSQNDDGDDSFHDNLSRVEEWIERLKDILRTNLESREWLIGISGAPIAMSLLNVISCMLEFKPEVRPLASAVLEAVGGAQKCCLAARETYVAATTDDSS